MIYGINLTSHFGICIQNSVKKFFPNTNDPEWQNVKLTFKRKSRDNNFHVDIPSSLQLQLPTRYRKTGPIFFRLKINKANTQHSKGQSSQRRAFEKTSLQCLQSAPFVALPSSVSSEFGVLGDDECEQRDQKVYYVFFTRGQSCLTEKWTVRCWIEPRVWNWGNKWVAAIFMNILLLVSLSLGRILKNTMKIS